MAENWWEQSPEEANKATTQTTNSQNWWEQSPEEANKATTQTTSSQNWWEIGAETPVDYNSFRSGAVGFVEGAIGAGDELDAITRLLSGEASSWDEAITQSRKELQAFEEDNPLAAKALTGAGFAAGFFIPGAGMAKVAQTGSKLARAGKVGALGSLEGAAYGALSGEGEEGRVEGALTGAAVGLGLGALGGAVLTKNADEIAALQKEADSKTYKGKGSYLGGEEGFVTVGRAKEQTRVGSATSTSTAKREVVDVFDDAPIMAPDGGQSGTVGNVFLSTREWFVKNVGERAARLAEDAELMIRHDQRAIDETFDTMFKPAADMFESKPGLKALSLRMNKSIKEDRRVSWDDIKSAATTPKETKLLEDLEQQIKVLQDLDFVKVSDVDYFPTKALGEFGTNTARPDMYDNPIKAVKEYAEDVSAARALAARFKIDVQDLRAPNQKTGESRLNVVIEAIEKEAKKQGASSDVAANLANGLRSQIIASKKGGNTVGAVARRATSAALLANPMNAILNIAEGITAPIYQNGVKAWAKTLPRAILSTFSENAGVKNKQWLSNRELGLDKDFMGELANVGEKAMNDAADAYGWTKLNDKFVKGVDYAGQKLYKYTGVSTVNRMGQEILSNSAVQRGRDLARKGTEKALEKLRQHDGMRGLTEKEFRDTVKALKAGDLSNPWLMNFAGASMNKWQPVTASAMPKAFHDNPNGRMAYSMLSYMNKQMNSLRLDVGLNILKAQQKGINSKEGAAAMREAMKNSAKYAGLFGVVAGVWDDGRKTLDLSKDVELQDVLTPDGISSAALNQIASNLTGGLYNMRADTYGGQAVNPIPAPITAAGTIASGVIDTGTGMLSGEPFSEAVTPLLKAGQTYVPGLSNTDKILRMTTGNRLFEELDLAY